MFRQKSNSKVRIQGDTASMSKSNERKPLADLTNHGGRRNPQQFTVIKQEKPSNLHKIPLQTPAQLKIASQKTKCSLRKYNDKENIPMRSGQNFNPNFQLPKKNQRNIQQLEPINTMRGSPDNKTRMSRFEHSRNLAVNQSELKNKEVSKIPQMNEKVEGQDPMQYGQRKVSQNGFSQFDSATYRNGYQGQGIDNVIVNTNAISKNQNFPSNIQSTKTRQSKRRVPIPVQENITENLNFSRNQYQQSLDFKMSAVKDKQLQYKHQQMPNQHREIKAEDRPGKDSEIRQQITSLISEYMKRLQRLQSSVNKGRDLKDIISSTAQTFDSFENAWKAQFIQTEEKDHVNNAEDQRGNVHLACPDNGFSHKLDNTKKTKSTVEKTPSKRSLCRIANQYSQIFKFSLIPRTKKLQMDEVPGPKSRLNSEFEILETLGQGSFGEVFKVRRITTGTFYALKKTIDPYLGIKDRERKLQEVKKWMHIQMIDSNPLATSHLVKCIEAWEESNHLYILSELCERGNLDNYLMDVAYEQNGNLLHEDEVWRILGDMARAVDQLHKKGFLHLDIKPQNFFVTKEGTVKLGDFGHVQEIENIQKTANDDLEGDSQYLPPELLFWSNTTQSSSNNATEKADIFSLGASLLEITFCMNLPKNGEMWKKLRENGQIKFCPTSNRSLDLESLINRMITKHPEDRPSAEEILSHPCVHQKCSIPSETLIDESQQRSTYKEYIRRLSKTPFREKNDTILFSAYVLKSTNKSIPRSFNSHLQSEKSNKSRGNARTLKKVDSFQEYKMQGERQIQEEIIDTFYEEQQNLIPVVNRLSFDNEDIQNLNPNNLASILTQPDYLQGEPLVDGNQIIESMKNLGESILHITQDSKCLKDQIKSDKSFCHAKFDL